MVNDHVSEQPVRRHQDWRERPHGIWYHRTTGIWQPVWLEAVPTTYTTAVPLVPDVPGAGLDVTVELNRRPAGTARLPVELTHDGVSLGRVEVTGPERTMMAQAPAARLRNGAAEDPTVPISGRWIPVHESWGVTHGSRIPAQRHYTRALASLTRALDPSRPVVSNDGWKHVDSDIWTMHDYTCLGYVNASSAEEFQRRLTDPLPAAARSAGLAGYCYTQLSDTGQETNGLLRADRTPKLPVEVIRALARTERA